MPTIDGVDYVFTIRVTVPVANVRSAPSTVGTANITRQVKAGTILNADQAAQADWYALTDSAEYIHHSVAAPYTVPPVVPLNYIPYRSQEDVDAKLRNNDCGPACVAMILGQRGIRVAINDIWEPDPMGLANCYDLVNNLSKYGVQSSVQILPAGQLPPHGSICLIWTGAFDRAYVQQKNFTGQHFVVFQWADISPEPAVVVHDPDYWGDSRLWGQYHRYPRDQWDTAQTKCDPSRQIVVIT